MPIQNKDFGLRYKWGMTSPNLLNEDFLREQERKKIIFDKKEKRRKKLEQLQEIELIRQIDIQYRIKKLNSL